jgi:hypothetical protein
MPLRKGGKKYVGSNIKEFMTGKTYKKTKRKFGAKKARKQAIAVALKTAGLSRKKKKKAKK